MALPKQHQGLLFCFLAGCDKAADCIPIGIFNAGKEYGNFKTIVFEGIGFTAYYHAINFDSLFKGLGQIE